MIFLALFMPTASASDFLQVDAAAPGMAVQANILRSTGGFTGSEVITTDCPDIVVGPVLALDRAANPGQPVSGSVLQLALYVDSGAASGQSCTISVDGVPLSAFNAGIDNLFSIVAPQSTPTDGGALDADGAVDGFITLDASARTDGGTLVLQSLDVPAGTTLLFDTSDPLSSTDGNEAFLPVILLVQGAATVDGAISLPGADGAYASYSASAGGDGGPGGGGGGVGSNCMGATAAAGDGFTGGGGTLSGTCIDFGYGGYGAAEGPDGAAGGEGIFTTVNNYATGYAGGTGGGTGVPWGTGGLGGHCCGTSGAGGYGGGGGNGHSEAGGWGAGGGGFGSAGENGIGVVGGANSGYQVGGAGLASGDSTLVPLAGGSGGGGGDSGSGTADGAGGGGGGGAMLLRAASIQFGSSALVEAYGGEGGDTRGVNPGSSTGGGGGSGGGIHLAASSISGLSAAVLDLSGGHGGVEGNGVYYSGDGGEGRLRVDGASPPSLTAGPTTNTPSSFEGAAFVALSDTTVTIASDESVTLWIHDSAGNYVTSLSLVEDGSATLWPYLPAAGTYLLTLETSVSGVLGPAGVMALEFTPDADLDGDWDPSYGGGDCDESDSSVYTGADEYCDNIDNNCDGNIDEDSALDALTWYADLDGDSYGNTSEVLYSCDQPSNTSGQDGDCDDANNLIHPGAVEICDGLDNDCDTFIDDDDPDLDASSGVTFYADADGDGYGDATNMIQACDQPEGYVAEATDCDDGSSANYPGADEVCDDVDNDCDGEIDNGAIDAPTWYGDNDGDGHGGDRFTVVDCDQPDNYVSSSDDCNDADAEFYPGAPETDCADPNDYNCDGSVGYADLDGDGFAACQECDDLQEAINPSATEICDGLDNDCSGLIDDNAVDAASWYADADGDGYGDPESILSACERPEGAVDDNTDCDDTDASVHPGAVEIADDGLDNDCLDGDAHDGGSDTGVDGKNQGGGGCDCSVAEKPPFGSVAGLLFALGAALRRRRGR